MLTNYDLEKIAKNYDIKLKGIFMKNELDKLQIEEGNYIINLDTEFKGLFFELRRYF